MEQFSLEKYLENPSRKVVTRDGRVVKILDTEFESGNGNKSVLAKCIYNGKAAAYVYTVDGRANNLGETENDLFFADEEEELTELQKTLEEDCDCYVNLYNDGKTKEELREWIKCWCNSIIDLARKELGLVDNTCLEYALNDAYKQGKQDALKDLPKWKKITDETNLSLTLSNGEYYLPLEGLEALPKEE